jgi:hypothetical protein
MKKLIAALSLVILSSVSVFANTNSNVEVNNSSNFLQVAGFTALLIAFIVAPAVKGSHKRMVAKH